METTNRIMLILDLPENEELGVWLGLERELGLQAGKTKNKVNFYFPYTTDYFTIDYTILNEEYSKNFPDTIENKVKGTKIKKSMKTLIKQETKNPFIMALITATYINEYGRGLGLRKLVKKGALLLEKTNTLDDFEKLLINLGVDEEKINPVKRWGVTQMDINLVQKRLKNEEDKILTREEIIIYLSNPANSIHETKILMEHLEDIFLGQCQIQGITTPTPQDITTALIMGYNTGPSDVYQIAQQINILTLCKNNNFHIYLDFKCDGEFGIATKNMAEIVSLKLLRTIEKRTQLLTYFGFEDIVEAAKKIGELFSKPPDDFEAFFNSDEYLLFSQLYSDNTNSKLPILPSYTEIEKYPENLSIPYVIRGMGYIEEQKK